MKNEKVNALLHPDQVHDHPDQVDGHPDQVDDHCLQTNHFDPAGVKEIADSVTNRWQNLVTRWVDTGTGRDIDVDNGTDIDVDDDTDS